MAFRKTIINLNFLSINRAKKRLAISIIANIFLITIFVSCNHLISNSQKRGNAISEAYQIASMFESLPRANGSLNKISKIKHLTSLGESYLLLIGSKGNLVVRKLVDGKLSGARLLFNLKLDLEKGVYAISDNWHYFAYHYRSKTVIYDLSSGEQVFASKSVRAPVTFMDFESSNNSLLVSSADTHVYRFKFIEASSCQGVVCERAKQRYIGHATVVTAAKHLNSTSVFFSSDWEGKVLVWKFFDAEVAFNNFNANLFSNRFFSTAANNVQFRKRDNDVVEKIEVNSNGTLLAVLLRSGFLEIWKIRGIEKVARFKALKGVPKKVLFSDDNLFLSVIDSNRMSLYSLQDIIAKEENLLRDENKKMLPIQTLTGVNFTDIVFTGKESLILLENNKSLKLVDLDGLVQDE